MAKETQSPKVKRASSKQRRGSQPGDKVVHREKKRSSASSSASRPPAPGTNYMKDRNKRDYEAKQRIQQRRQENVRKRGLVMLEIFDKTMRSTSAAATEELLTIAATYLGSYVQEADLGWPERHARAKGLALEGCSPALLRYATRQLDSAEYTSRPPKKDQKVRQDSAQRPVAHVS